MLLSSGKNHQRTIVNLLLIRITPQHVITERQLLQMKHSCADPATTARFNSSGSIGPIVPDVDQLRRPD